MKREATSGQRTISIPDTAVHELEEVGAMDPAFTLEDLVDWVNSAVARFYPEANASGDRRVSDSFTARTLRHYQTLGCLDAPEKEGRRAIYRFRHYLQALLIRKLLYLRCAPESIRISLEGKSNRQYKDMLLGDLHIMRSGPPSAVLPSSPDSSAASSAASGVASPAASGAEAWTRISLGPDAELHLKGSSGEMPPGRKKKLLRQIEHYLRQP